MSAGGRGLRRTRASRLTAARDLQDLRDIEMRFQMIGERVKRGFYAGFVGQRRCDAEMREPRLPKGVAGEQAMHIGTLHPAIGRAGAVGAAFDVKQKPRTVGTLAAAAPVCRIVSISTIVSPSTRRSVSA